MNDARRLKRGLKDLSPLFEPAVKMESRLALKNYQPVQSWAVSCPSMQGENLSLSAALALEMKTFGAECALFSIRSGSGTLSHKPLTGDYQNLSVKRFVLSLDQLDEACRLDSRTVPSFGNPVFFFDFDYSNPIQFKKIVPMLDKWILFLKPELESLTESFKFIKASLAVNPSLEYFVAYYGAEHPEKAALLYERFSETVSKRLGVSLHWLGSFDRRIPGSIQGISLESLQVTSSPDTLEKRALANYVYPGASFKG